MLLLEKVFLADIEEKYTKDYPLTLCLNFETANLIFCLKISENDRFQTFPVKCLLTHFQSMFDLNTPESRGFLIISGDAEMEHCMEMGKYQFF